MQTLEAGQISQLRPGVRRVVAPNGSVMTGSGTNTYLLGREAVAVVDPGPADRSHIDAIISACEGRLDTIFVTHTHRDHSPAAAVLARECDARLIGASPPSDPFQDTSFVPDQELSDGDLYETPEWSVRAIHTPGHVGNHFCLLLENEGLLMTGDHIMNGSTVVIIPPSGDMKDYIDSLRKLLDYDIAALAPGHGELMDEPGKVVEWIIEHRLERERKVIRSMQECGISTIQELVKVVYDDVDESLHKTASMSLWAHLIKLQKEHIAGTDEIRWFLLT